LISSFETSDFDIIYFMTSEKLNFDANGMAIITDLSKWRSIRINNFYEIFFFTKYFLFNYRNIKFI